MTSKYPIPENEPQMLGESVAAYVARPTTIHLDITVEDNAMASQVQKILNMIKGVTSVRIADTETQVEVSDPFAELNTSWGGDRDANEIADELHAMRTDSRIINIW